LKKRYGSDKVIIKKNTIPLTIKKAEHIMWYKSGYKAIAYISRCSNNLKKSLKAMLTKVLGDNSNLYFIVWGSDEITMNNIRKVFDNSYFIKTFPPTGNYLIKSGAVIMFLNYSKDSMSQIDYWGTLDRIQIIVPLIGKEDNIREIICTDTYIYNRHDFKIIDQIMKYAKIVINDTGDGEEFELIFHETIEQELQSITESIFITDGR